MHRSNGSVVKVEAMAETKSNIELKLVVDSRAGKVLYAEADKKFIDFIFTLLSLPLATVVRLLKDHSMVGCLTNLYESIEALNDSYLEPNQTKVGLLKPKVISSSKFPAPLTNTDSTFATTFYSCSTYVPCRYNFSDDPKANCPSCKQNSMSSQTRYVDTRSGISQVMNGGDIGCVKGLVLYMVMDDLSVKPLSSHSNLTILKEFNVRDVRDVEEKVITLGVNEGVRLLHASLQSKTVLTDVFWEECCKSESDSTLQKQ